MVIVAGEADLLEVVGALDTGRGVADFLHGRQQHRDQDGDDGDDHQQFDQRGTPTAPAGPPRWTWCRSRADRPGGDGNWASGRRPLNRRRAGPRRAFPGNKNQTAHGGRRETANPALLAGKILVTDADVGPTSATDGLGDAAMVIKGGATQAAFRAAPRPGPLPGRGTRLSPDPAHLRSHQPRDRRFRRPRRHSQPFLPPGDAQQAVFAGQGAWQDQFLVPVGSAK